MKISFFNCFVGFLFSLFCFGVSQAQTYVEGYTKSNGTYVEGHYRSDRNSTNHDNYSTKTNENPYTGSKGTKERTILWKLKIMVKDVIYKLVQKVDNTT